ncbi:hypothetical protein Glove_132g180 [Diversispora epigaea]|uniref:CCHC-type domain-containing protein n=1 Tax=Diversispora epigaea TaxID=1348612 RepID=A0A397J252_9GLOM|nr:hypothetical protein Glove_132g180 [Diversispora epigaea]
MNIGENEANVLILELQNAFRIRNDVRMLLFFRGNQDPMKWLEEFNRLARINQYTDEYKLQVVSGYLQGTAGQWFNEAQEGQNPINYWNNTNQTSFEMSFLATFRTTALINQWRFELQMKMAIIDGVKTKTFGNIAYQARPFIISQEKPTLEKAIRMAKQFKENAQTYSEAITGYITTTSIGMQGSVPFQSKNNESENVIEQIIQKAFTPIAKTIHKPTLEKAIRMAKQFKENAQTYSEAITGYITTTSIGMQGSVPFQSKNNESENVIEQIIQKAFTPIAKTIHVPKIDFRFLRFSVPITFVNITFMLEVFEGYQSEGLRRLTSNYNNNNRGQSYNNYNSNRGQSFRSYNNSPNCYHCGQTGHMAWSCSIRQGNQRNQINPAASAAPRPTNTVHPSINTAANQIIQQVLQRDANNNTFITQEEEIQQPISIVDNDRVIEESIGFTSKQDVSTGRKFIKPTSIGYQIGVGFINFRPVFTIYRKKVTFCRKEKEVSKDPKQKKRKKVLPVQQPLMTQNTHHIPSSQIYLRQEPISLWNS